MANLKGQVDVTQSKQCAKCGAEIEPASTMGRPRAYCVKCRPARLEYRPSKRKIPVCGITGCDQRGRRRCTKRLVETGYLCEEHWAEWSRPASAGQKSHYYFHITQWIVRRCMVCNEPFLIRSYENCTLDSRHCSQRCANKTKAQTFNPMNDPEVRARHGQKISEGIAKTPQGREWARHRAQEEIERQQREVDRRRRRAQREQVETLRAMLREVKRLAGRMAAPCPCPACRATRARQYRYDQRSRKKDLVLELKGRMCLACGGMFEPEELHFHHLDPETKRFELSRGRAWQFNADEIVAEARKCIVVCFRCHMDIHRGKPAPQGRQLRLI